MMLLKLVTEDKVIYSTTFDEQIFNITNVLTGIRAVFFRDIDATFHIPTLLAEGRIDSGWYQLTLETVD